MKCQTNNNRNPSCCRLCGLFFWGGGGGGGGGGGLGERDPGPGCIPCTSKIRQGFKSPRQGSLLFFYKISHLYAS